MLGSIHVIDPDVRRRAKIARLFLSRDMHAEIYDGIDEFMRVAPKEGLIFSVDERALDSPRGPVDILVSSGVGQPVVAYSAEILAVNVVEAIQTGALEYLQWPFESQHLDRILAKLEADGENLVRRVQFKADAVAAVQRLSPREREVLSLLAKGNSNKGIAAALEISPRTVEIHRGNMMTKLKAQSIADAVRIAIYADLDLSDERDLSAAA